jgi:hypothetical protein
MGHNVYLVTRLRAGRSGVRIRAEANDILFPKTSRSAVDPSNLLSSGYWGSLPELKWPGSEVNYSNAEVQNEWSHTCTPSVCLRGRDREKFAWVKTFKRL